MLQVEYRRTPARRSMGPLYFRDIELAVRSITRTDVIFNVRRFSMSRSTPPPIVSNTRSSCTSEETFKSSILSVEPRRPAPFRGQDERRVLVWGRCRDNLLPRYHP